MYNNTVSKSFELHRGVRQLLTVGLRSYPHIGEFTHGSSESLVSLYADNVLFTLTNPETGIPSLLN